MNAARLARDRTMGDASVDGFLCGILAGAVMVAYLIAAGTVSGENPATVLARFSASAPASPVVGGLQHLAVSGIYGALFGITWWAFGRQWRRNLSIGRMTLAGLGYGLLLWLIAVSVILPATHSPLGEAAPVHLLLAHALYGATLGLALGRAFRRGP